MRNTLIVLSIGLILALMPARAQHCLAYSTSENDDDTIVLDLGPAAIEYRYFVKDVCTVIDDCLVTFFLYYESNDIEGLQRTDYIVDDTCHGIIRGDSFIT